LPPGPYKMEMRPTEKSRITKMRISNNLQKVMSHFPSGHRNNKLPSWYKRIKWKEPPSSHLFVLWWYKCIYSKIPLTQHARDRTGIGYYALSDGTYTDLQVTAHKFLSVLLHLGQFQFFQRLFLEEVLHTFTKCHKQLRLVHLLLIS
jgi:hypothetical protein